MAYSPVAKSPSLRDHYARSRDENEKVKIVWKDIRFETIVKNKEKSKICSPVHDKKIILDGLNGSAESGQLLAILGPTGCGKTSLLNVLAARVPNGGQSFAKLSGTVIVNGKIRNENKFRRISAYVLQDDHMYDNLTVFETLMLCANFFLPSSKSTEEKLALVEGVIAELGLVKARDTIIGNDEKRGVSGGERKRTAIAVQMLCDPAVLFLDEPTSGLDAFQSQALMECLKNLANHNRLIITVIHQPRSSIYEMFDKLLVLSKGRTMYYGDASAAVEHFNGLGHRCPQSFNPSDYFLDLLSPDDRTPESEILTRNRIAMIGDAWEELSRSGSVKVDDESALVAEEDSAFAQSVKAIGTESTLEKDLNTFFLLCWRCWVNQFRDSGALAARFIGPIIFALILGGIYSDIGYSQASIQNRKGLLFFVVINQVFGTVTNVFESFPIEKTIVNRERSNNAYPTLSYYIAKVFVELPLNLAPPLVYSLIVYHMVGLNAPRYGYFILILLLTNFVGIALGYCISAFVPNVDAALAIGPTFLIIGILFGGFYISVDSLPIVANWIPYMSLFRWGFQALCINEFKGLQFDCDSDDTTQCYATGEEVLRNLTFQGHTTSYAVFGSGMLLVAFLVIGYFILEMSALRFMPLGFAGSKYHKLEHKVRPSDSDVALAQPAAGAEALTVKGIDLEESKTGHEYEMVAVSDQSSAAPDAHA